MSHLDRLGRVLAVEVTPTFWEAAWPLALFYASLVAALVGTWVAGWLAWLGLVAALLAVVVTTWWRRRLGQRYPAWRHPGRRR